MDTIILDENQIWTDNSKVPLSYLTVGNDFCFDIEENSFWFRHRNAILKSVIERFPFKNNYADVGGGNGFQAKFIKNNFSFSKVFLVEPGYPGCLNAKQRGLENVYNLSFQKFDFKGNDINAVGLYDVLEHIENDVAFLKEMKLKLPEKSLIYLTVPAHNYLWSDVDISGGHFRRYNSKMIEKLATDAGLEFLYSSYFFTYIPTLTFFFRCLPYKIFGARTEEEILKSESKQHNPSSALLKVLNIFHRYELNKIRTATIPIGGSCIAVLKT